MKSALFPGALEYLTLAGLLGLLSIKWLLFKKHAGCCLIEGCVCFQVQQVKGAGELAASTCSRAAAWTFNCIELQ